MPGALKRRTITEEIHALSRPEGQVDRRDRSDKRSATILSFGQLAFAGAENPEDSVEGVEYGLQSCLGYLERHCR